jgi:hypothetical protein
MPAKTSISLLFDRTRETKGTWVYEERMADSDNGRPAVGKVYITKQKLGTFGATPTVLRVTIEAGE